MTSMPDRHRTRRPPAEPAPTVGRGAWTPILAVALLLRAVTGLGAEVPRLQGSPGAETQQDQEAQEAQLEGEASESTAESEGRDEDTVVYELAFYDKYNPVTALEVVERTPGFSVARQGDRRGFQGASGNVLIDGERPSSKSDSVSDILSRIPAGQVVRVELIRGATGGLDVSRQSIVANVVLQRDAGRGGSGFAEVETSLEADRINLSAELSYDGRLGGTDYLVGVERRAFDRRTVGTEELVRAAGSGQRRQEVDVGDGQFWNASFRTATRVGEADVLRFNGQFSYDPGEGREVSERFPLDGGPAEVVTESSSGEGRSFELGGDWERVLSDAGRLKIISLVRRDLGDRESSLEIEPPDGPGELRQSLSDSTDGETIGRAELDWRLGEHAVQLSGEVAHNFVDSDFRLFEDRGGGAGLVPVDVEGGDSRVSELRAEIVATDSWNLAAGWTLDGGLAFEHSTISQSGDVTNERTFDFLKPSLAVTYSPSGRQQWRFRVEREVAQLDFFDFVSNVDFGDQELEFGNPELEPQQTWALEATWELRFGELGVVEVRGLHDSIPDVQDPLPLGETFEVTGNIGDGSRTGIDLDATVSLDLLRLSNSRLELGLLAQDTSVTDPVTGRDRSLSGERDHRWRVAYRQEFPGVRLSWGGSLRDASERASFGLDEIEVSDDEAELELFLEKVLGGRFKLRFDAENLLDGSSTRERRVFAGPRDTGLLRFRELRGRTEGREFSLSLTSTF